MNKHDHIASAIDRRMFIGLSGAATGSMLFNEFGFGWQEQVESAIKKRLNVHTEVPHNAEPSLDKLVKSFMTPTENFYVRSHAPVPKIDAARFRLSVKGLVHKPFQVTLKQLRDEFKKQSVVATMTCAGNRRSEHSLVKEVSGVQWQAGAIGNAQWGGALLSELLKKAEVKGGAKHVWFEGVDEIKRTSGIIPFGGSIPLRTAMTDTSEMPGALVAYEMNEKPLLPDHGFPMRTVVPGFIGARSVKWLGKIIVSDRPSTNHYVAKAYKLVTEGADDEWSKAKPIYNFPINSVTCLPASGAKLKEGAITISGYALAPGIAGHTVSKVELSTNGGKTWTTAKLTTRAKPMCWRLWTARVRLTSGKAELVVRATDSKGNVQPEKVDWNLKGYLFNAWHRTSVGVES